MEFLSNINPDIMKYILDAGGMTSIFVISIVLIILIFKPTLTQFINKYFEIEKEKIDLRKEELLSQTEATIGMRKAVELVNKYDAKIDEHKHICYQIFDDIEDKVRIVFHCPNCKETHTEILKFTEDGKKINKSTKIRG